jgi:malonate-semialdehyde dehydrogenase (acetylating)/methylmalonate-semialdehyde dehydrogenase
MTVRRLKNYVNGQWCDPADATYLPVENPSTGAVIAEVPLTTAADVGRSVAAADQAFLAWRNVPVARRAKFLYDLLRRMEADEEGLTRVLVEEMGKSLPDARAELKRAFENIETACGMPVLQQGDKLIGGSFEIDGEVLRVPIGVCAVIPPFNFPAMVPFWFVPYALATGNTVIVKASEQVPCTMQRIAGHFEAVGLPPGVFTLLNGDRTAAGALIDHPLVRAVSLVGSSATARAVARQCAERGKRVQAMGGAKNHLVVMPDARIPDVVRNMITSCYGCAGQRCMAASVIVGVGEATYAAVVKAFVEASRTVIVADPLDPAVTKEEMVMGPVISARAKAFIHRMIATGVREGATLALDGRGVSVKGRETGHFVGPTVFTNVKPGMEIHRTEVFGPVVCMMQAASLDEAIRIINGLEYGNGASIYTQNGYYARKFKLETDVGMIGINVGIPAPVACLPFGGMKASLLADIKAQGREVIDFFTHSRIVTERYWKEG